MDVYCDRIHLNDTGEGLFHKPPATLAVTLPVRLVLSQLCLQILIICSYPNAITQCWVNKYGGLEVMPSIVLQKLLDKAVAFNENCPEDLKAVLENLRKEDRARGILWDDLEFGHIWVRS